MIETMLIIVVLGGIEIFLWMKDNKAKREEANEQLAILHAIYAELPRPKPRKKKTVEGADAEVVDAKE